MMRACCCFSGRPKKKASPPPPLSPPLSLLTRPVAAREVAALAHEVGDDAVEGGTLEVEGLAGPPRPLLPGAQGAEVFGGLGDDVGAQLKGGEGGGMRGKGVG